jgi:enamine deaminase RidA (YjgF/YER057c/UK114 family)
MTSQRITDGSAFEQTAGYSRAVRHDNLIAVSATAALSENGVLHPGDAYAQTREALARAVAAATELGATNDTILRTRLLLAPGCNWQDAIRAHREAFTTHTPANTTYYVGGFIPHDVLVEVELDAVASAACHEPVN